MKNKKFLIVFNPKAGKDRNTEKLEGLKGFLAANDLEYILYDTTPNRKANIAAMNELVINSEITEIIVLGGDGTLNEVVNSTIGLNLPVNILPTGTGNDFIKNLQIGSYFNHQLEGILRGTVKWVDVGQCNKAYFLNGVGIGYDGLVAKEVKENTFFFKGHAAYYFIAVKNLLFYKSHILKFKIDGKLFVEPVFLLTIGNGTTFGGGFMITPHAVIDDGIFDVCHVGAINPLKRFLNIDKLNKGHHQSIKEVMHHNAQYVWIDANPQMIAHMDGEIIGSPPLDIKFAKDQYPVKVFD